MQVFMGKALYYVKPALKVSHYFQVLALFKSFWRRLHPTLLKQELQAIQCSKQHTSITDKLIKFVKLSTWWLPQTSGTHIWESRWFKLMYTLQGKTWPTCYTHPTLSPRMVLDHTYLMWSMHSILSWVADRFGWIPLLLRKRFPTQSLAHRSTDPWIRTQSLSQVNQWSSRLKPSFYRWQPTRLTGLISPACDQYVQYLLTMANPSVLNWHRRGLQPWRCQLFTYHSPTFPTDGLPFPPKGPARSPV
jgi:hypothetical protein